MGHHPTQEHTFRCVGCGEYATVLVTLIPERATCDIKCVVNCEPGDAEGVVVNLHPDFPIPEDQLHQDLSFPWLGQLQDIGKAQEALLPEFKGFESIEALERFAKDVKGTAETWPIVKKAWSLTRSGRADLALPVLQQYKTHGYNEGPDLDSVLFHFCWALLRPGRLPLFQDANKWTAQVSNNDKAEFARFREHYRHKLFTESLDRYFDIFQEYFRDFGEYTQTLLLCQYDLPLPPDAAASSVAFRRTKMFLFPSTRFGPH